MHLPQISALDLRSTTQRPAVTDTPRPRRRMKGRAFQAAEMSRLFASWTSSNTSIDNDLRRGLRVIRSRSRQLAQNNDYMKKFLWLMAQNVIGPRGIGLQMRCGDFRDGALVMDKPANALIENAWNNWGKPRSASVSGKLSWRDIQRLVMWGIVRDGEFLALRLRGAQAGNPFGYTLQPLDPDYLDEEKNEELAGGKRIRMGVEMTAAGRPTHYHLLEWHPGDFTYAHKGGWTHRRVPAEDVIHIFLAERAEQTRGVPWFYTAMRRLHQLGEYELAEVIAARIGASKMGFFQSKTGEEARWLAEDQDDDELDDDDAPLVMDAEPGKFHEIPEGLEFKPFEVDHPNAGFDKFIKAMLRGVASGLGVNYVSLSSDLEGVSFSSIRQGVLDERDYYMMLQEWVLEHFHQDIFDDWLPLALFSGQVNLPITKLAKWAAAKWCPRRWSWVDPMKDIKAAEVASERRWKSGHQIAGDMGLDWDDTQDEIDAENERLNSSKEKENHGTEND